MIATVVIPVSPEHRRAGVFQEAVASAEAQTLRTAVVVVHDSQQRGAAWARNTGTRRVKTPFVVYLDADDLLEPAFVEQTLQHYRPGAYVYTDWRLPDRVRRAPDCLQMHRIGQEHITPTLLPLAAWAAVGGFDETLPTLEDEDFYRRLYAYGWQGVRCPGALVHYRRDQGHSLVNRDRHGDNRVKARVAEMAALFTARYQRFESIMCGCVENKPALPPSPAGQPGPNDVLAEALYTPMVKYGPVSGRKYPRAGLSKPLWVDAADAEARPEWWRVIAPNPARVSPDTQTVTRLAEAAVAQPAPVQQPASKPRNRKRNRRAS